MDGYKRIIKSRKLRHFILSCLRFVSDKAMLKLQYKIKLKRKLDLNNPKRFTEKLQKYKISYKNPVVHQCVDKYAVRKYIEEKGLSEILVDIYGKYNSIKEVEWDKLPNKFVIKTTNGSGGLNVVLCKDKSTLDIDKLKECLVSKKTKSRTEGREWAYYGLAPGVIVEQLLINEKNPDVGVNDYKILCFNGKVECIIVDVDRYIGHKRNFYDINWNRLLVTSDCPGADRDIEKPQNLERMIEIAEILSKDFPFVRVDLYNVEGKIYFGELTFYPWSGYVQFEPDSFDFDLGEKFNLVN